MKRLNVEIPEELHKQLKIRAAERCITIKKWIIRAINLAVKEEQKYE